MRLPVETAKRIAEAVDRSPWSRREFADRVTARLRNGSMSPQLLSLKLSGKRRITVDEGRAMTEVLQEWDPSLTADYLIGVQAPESLQEPQT